MTPYHHNALTAIKDRKDNAKATFLFYLLLILCGLCIAINFRLPEISFEGIDAGSNEPFYGKVRIE